MDLRRKVFHHLQDSVQVTNFIISDLPVIVINKIMLKICLRAITAFIFVREINFNFSFSSESNLRNINNCKLAIEGFTSKTSKND